VAYPRSNTGIFWLDGYFLQIVELQSVSQSFWRIANARLKFTQYNCLKPMCDTCESGALIGVIVITIQVRISKACQMWCQRLEPESLSELQRLPKTKKENLHPPPQTQLAVVTRFQRQRSSSVNTRHCTKMPFPEVPVNVDNWWNDELLGLGTIWETIKRIQFSSLSNGY
jgi:hypothetical protein